jgi:hypothetical protein
MYWNNHGKVPWTSTGITIPNNTSFVVNVSGIITAARNPHWDPNDPTCSMCGEYGPAGDWGGDHYQSRTLGVKLRLDRVDGSQMYLAYGPMGRSDPTVRTDTIFTNWGGTIWVAREGMHPTGCWPVGGGQECDGKYLMSGTQTVEVLRVAPTMRLVASKTRVVAGTPVTFTPLNQSNQQVQDITWWHWEAPSPVGGACAPNDGQPCTFTVNQTGRMAVWANLDGRSQFSYSDYVMVVPPKIKLVASKTKAVVGEVLMYTASPDPDYVSMSISGWRFRPDDTTKVATTPCGAGAVTCADSARTSGTMWVYGTVHGVADSASAHVDVIKCPTGNPVLDEPEVRTGLLDMMKRSNPDSTPGSGIDPADWMNTGYKKERGVWIVKRPDGTYYTIPMGGTSTECGIRSATVPTLPPGDSIVAMGHSHPSMPGDSLYGCETTLPDGTVIKGARFKGDSTSAAVKGDEWDTGGGSYGDWKMTTDLAWNIDVYTMTKSGYVWRLPKDWGWAKRADDKAGRRKDWKTAACSWE